MDRFMVVDPGAGRDQNRRTGWSYNLQHAIDPARFSLQSRSLLRPVEQEYEQISGEGLLDCSEAMKEDD